MPRISYRFILFATILQPLSWLPWHLSALFISFSRRKEKDKVFQLINNLMTKVFVHTWHVTRDKSHVVINATMRTHQQIQSLPYVEFSNLKLLSAPPPPAGLNNGFKSSPALSDRLQLNCSGVQCSKMPLPLILSLSDIFFGALVFNLFFKFILYVVIVASKK